MRGCAMIGWLAAAALWVAPLQSAMAQALSTAPSFKEGLPMGREIRAQVTPRESTMLASAMAGRIREVAVKDGERFEAGAVLVRFDCAVQDAQLARARATLEKKRRVSEAHQRLGRLGSVSALDQAVSAAEVAESEAELRVMQAMVERCAVKAPYAGRVSGVMVREHQFLGEGQPLLDIVDDHAFEVELIVPSAWLGWLKPGHRFAVHVDETGKGYPAEVRRLSGRVDPVSQSIKVYGAVTGGTPDLFAGMSGRADLAPPASRP